MGISLLLTWSTTGGLAYEFLRYIMIHAYIYTNILCMCVCFNNIHTNPCIHTCRRRLYQGVRNFRKVRDRALPHCCIRPTATRGGKNNNQHQPFPSYCDVEYHCPARLLTIRTTCNCSQFFEKKHSLACFCVCMYIYIYVRCVRAPRVAKNTPCFIAPHQTHGASPRSSPPTLLLFAYLSRPARAPAISVLVIQH